VKNTIEKTMNELRTDHRNMVLLLDTLDAETSRLIEHNEPDYELIDEIMCYMSDYPDAVHHPKEDMIYRHIHATHPEVEESLQHIEADHKALAAATLHILRELDALVPDEVPDHERLTTALQKYSQSLREHMFWEEKDLFALADTMSEDAAWVELLREYEIPQDPLFGNAVERKFRRLFNRIQQRVVWDNQQYFV
jgi:hemerythrin-like domain-containing protein